MDELRCSSALYAEESSASRPGCITPYPELYVARSGSGSLAKTKYTIPAETEPRMHSRYQ